jgi:signal transduction histidine kinase
VSSKAETRPALARKLWPWVTLAGFVVTAALGSSVKVANGTSVGEDAIFIVVFFGYGVVGALIASRMPGNRIAVLLLFVSGLSAIAFGAAESANYRLDHGRDGSLEGWLVLLGDTGWIFGLLPGLLLLLQLFPDGRPRWRWLAWATFAFVGLGFVAILGQPELGEPTNLPNPLYVSALSPITDLIEVIFFTFLGLVVLSFAAIVARFRSAEGAERQQIRWMAFAAGLLVICLVLSELLTELGWSELVTSTIAAVGIAALPTAIGIAVLRYRLWDLDLVVRKTVLGALVLVMLLAVFGFLTLVGQATVSVFADDFVSGGAGEYVLALIVGALLWPIFRLSRRIADRIVYGRRAAPYEVLGTFTDRVGATYADDDVLGRMATVVGEGLGAERVDVWLERGGSRRLSATWPTDGDAEGAVTDESEREAVYVVEFRGERLGALGVRKGPGDRLNGTDRTLVVKLAAQAGPVLHNVALTEQLKARLDDLRAAQRRLVTAQDEERRRLERNIHDGAQQQLVALAVKLRLTQSIVGSDAEKARGLLEDLQKEASEALDDLRDLARGIYPPLLADKGLTAALEAQTKRSTLPVHVRSSADLGRFPQEVEAAVYFSCLEGLQNVAKYADATDVSVTIEQRNGDLTFEVADDGKGFDPVRTKGGTGLQGIADRVAALAGAVVVDSSPGRGTTLRGRIPVSARSDER